MKFRHINELKRESEDIFLLGSGEGINNITEKQWNVINNTDNLAMNNFFYHPFFVPRMLSLELKSYDFDIAKRRLEEKWERGWKNVKYILSSDRVSYISGAIGHSHSAQIYVYDYKSRGTHPKLKSNVKINADFNPNNVLYKSYDATTSTMIHFIYQMGYKNVILIGFTGNNSKYFWTDMTSKERGEVHANFNKDHEHNDPKKKHNAFHMGEYIIDFNKRHFLPNNREIFIGNEKTMLYPELRLWNW